MSSPHSQYFRSLADFLGRDLSSDNPVRLAGALHRVRRALAPFRAQSDDSVRGSIRRTDLLQIVAREAGYASWQDLLTMNATDSPGDDSATSGAGVIVYTGYGEITIDAGGTHLSSSLVREEGLDSASLAYNFGLDIIESLVLAHVAEGVDVTSFAYARGVTTALDAASNNLDSVGFAPAQTERRDGTFRYVALIHSRRRETTSIVAAATEEGLYERVAKEYCDPNRETILRLGGADEDIETALHLFDEAIRNGNWRDAVRIFFEDGEDGMEVSGFN